MYFYPPPPPKKPIQNRVTEEVTFNRIDFNFEDIMPCNLEEADRRLILHISDFVEEALSSWP